LNDKIRTVLIFATKWQYILSQWQRLGYKKATNYLRPERAILILFCPFRARILCNYYSTQGVAFGQYYEWLTAKKTKKQKKL